MNIMEAVNYLKQGKKIRRKTWNSRSHLRIEPNNPLIINDYSEYFRPAIESLLATDWEVFQENNNCKKYYSEEKFKNKDKFCWLCGTKENITRHHLQLRRFRNVSDDKEKGTIPLCKDCHVNVEKLRNSRQKMYKARHKKIFIDIIQNSKLITEKQKVKLIPQLNTIWGDEDVEEEND